MDNLLKDFNKNQIELTEASQTEINGGMAFQPISGGFTFMFVLINGVAQCVAD